MQLDHDHTWSLEEALKKQVAREDIVAWARKEDAPHKAIPDTATKPWTLPNLYAVFSYIAL